jgi:glycosyltransferase involved in cell wall biosynthesis
VKKLVIQIPCYNEASALPITLSQLPRKIEGVDRVEWLIIDDGSTDGTVQAAEASGADHIVRHKSNLGLARAFQTGIEEALRVGAHIIVNTDADNQYRAEDISKLVEPILNGEADVVIGTRPVGSISHFSATKKLLQRVGSWFARKLSRTSVKDAPSGFRAISRDAALRMNILSEYTYTLETLIQAGQTGMVVKSVPVRTNAPMRPSRLISGQWTYVWKSLVTMVRIYMTYRPFEFFLLPGLVLCFGGGLLFLRYFVIMLQGGGKGHVQSVVVGAMLLVAGGGAVVLALVVDLIGVNRKLLEKQNRRLAELEAQVRGLGKSEDG